MQQKWRQTALPQPADPTVYTLDHDAFSAKRAQSTKTRLSKFLARRQPEG